MSATPYPLILEPIFETAAEEVPQTPPLFDDFCQRHRLAPPADRPASQLWLLCDAPGRQSIVANGPWAGRQLRELVESQPQELIGRDHSGEKPFPLCVRVFATARQQPLLVHPDEEAPADLYKRHGSMKFWYSLAVERGARAFVGLHPRASLQQLFGQLNTPDARRFLQKFQVREGDSCLIPPGVVHSLSAGHLTWEMQPRAVSPLRLCDGGDHHEIPPEEQQAARQSLKMESRQSMRTAKVRGSLTHTRKISLTPHWPYFSVEEIRIADHIFLETDGRQFQLLYTIAGAVAIQYRNSETVELPPGRVCCLPAKLGSFKLTAPDTAEVLRAGPLASL